MPTDRTDAPVTALIDALPRVTLVVGKGGVGKTTCAAALAVRAASPTHPARLLSTDPARALPDVLDTPVGAEFTAVPYAQGLEARVLDAASLRDAFLARWSDVLRLILDRGTYLDAEDIAPMVDTALPGGDEIFAALELGLLLKEATRAGSRLFVDTAPTGHTLRLLELPTTFRALVRLLDAMQAKHRFMVRTLARGYRRDEADAFLAEMSDTVAALERGLTDAATCAALLVGSGQMLVHAETSRYAESLRDLGIAIAGMVWNGVGPDEPVPPLDGVGHHWRVPRLPGPPVGEAGLKEWAAALEPIAATGAGEPPVGAGWPQSSGRSNAHHALEIAQAVQAVLRPLTIVAGKGGVGKTTVACALALASPTRNRTLLVSTDPAPSLADALGIEIPDADTPVPERDGLFARQMDATAAFARLRDEYQERVDAVFDSLVGRGLDLSADRAIVRDLLALAPPGVDEIHALTLVADALLDARFDTVVVDPAPTGHLLRLLEMPALALAWTHQLMRLLLKYRDVTGLGDTAQDLLDFSKRLRAMQALLADERRAGVVLVTLDEPVVRAESTRLRQAVRERGVALRAVVHNRSDRPATLPATEGAVHLVAPHVVPPPSGIEALREWAAQWRIMQQDASGR